MLLRLVVDSVNDRLQLRVKPGWSGLGFVALFARHVD
jgi:hypothetical protein